MGLAVCRPLMGTGHPPWQDPVTTPCGWNCQYPEHSRVKAPDTHKQCQCGIPGRFPTGRARRDLRHILSLSEAIPILNALGKPSGVPSDRPTVDPWPPLTPHRLVYYQSRGLGPTTVLGRRETVGEPQGGAGQDQPAV